jgi:hypothetical protein
MERAVKIGELADEKMEGGSGFGLIENPLPVT